MSDVIEEAKAKIKGRDLKLVMPEGRDARIRDAAQILKDLGLAAPVVLQDDLPNPNPGQIGCVQRLRPKMSVAMAAKLLSKPLFYGCALVAAGEADACLAGVENPTARVIEAALMTIGLAEGIEVPSSFFLMQWPDRRLIFADCAVNVQPSAEQLAAIAIASARSAVTVLQEKPRVAMLSFSTHGSASHADAEKVERAVAILKSRPVDFDVDGGLQGDAALSIDVAARKLKHASSVAGKANVLVFPDLDAGNIAYKLMQELGGAQAIGPVLQGFNKPVSDLSRGATVDDIVSTAALLLSMVPG